MNQDDTSRKPFAALTDDQLNALKSETAELQHEWLRDVAHERLAQNLATKRHAAVEILEAFIENITGKPVPKVNRAMVDRMAGAEPIPHPQAALRK